MNIYKDFLNSVYEATKQKQLSWSRKEKGEFVANGKISITIRQVVPLVAGPTETIGPQAFEIAAASVSFTVWDGTESCDIVRDILAQGLPEWAIHQRHVADALSGLIRTLGQ